MLDVGLDSDGWKRLFEDDVQLAEKEDFGAPLDEVDARRRIITALHVRRGQGAFRAHLIRAWKGQCAVTGSKLLPILEAAHIRPWRGDQTNRPDNGLLLRADIDTLFDRDLIGIDAGMHVVIAPALVDSEYNEYAGRALKLPKRAADRPDPGALAERLALLEEKNLS